MNLNWTFDIYNSKHEEEAGTCKVTITEENWEKIKKALDVETPMPETKWQKVKIDISQFVDISKIKMGDTPILRGGLKAEIYAWANASYIPVDGEYPGHKGYNGMERICIDLSDEPRRSDIYYVRGLPYTDTLERIMNGEISEIDYLNDNY